MLLGQSPVSWQIASLIQQKMLWKSKWTFTYICWSLLHSLLVQTQILCSSVPYAGYSIMLVAVNWKRQNGDLVAPIYLVKANIWTREIDTVGLPLLHSSLYLPSLDSRPLFPVSLILLSFLKSISACVIAFSAYDLLNTTDAKRVVFLTRTWHFVMNIVWCFIFKSRSLYKEIFFRNVEVMKSEKIICLNTLCTVWFRDFSSAYDLMDFSLLTLDLIEVPKISLR